MKKLLLAVAIAAIVSGRASAVLILNDNFDSYANQAAFEAAWTPIGTASSPHTASAVLSSAQSVTAPNSVHVPANAVPGTAGPYRNQRSFTESETFSSNPAVNLGIGDRLVFSFDYYDVGTTAAPNPQRNHSNLQDGAGPSGTNQLIALGLNNNQANTASGGNYFMARVLGYNPVANAADPDGGPAETVGGTSTFFKLNDFGVGLRNATAGWRNLKVEISTDDGQSTDYSFFVDNQLAERLSNIGTSASIRSYDVIRLGSGLGNGNTQAFFDNMKVEFIAVPEAGSFAAVGLVGLLSAAAVWYKKRRAAA